MKYQCFVLNIQCGRLLNQFPSFDVGTDYRKNGPLTRGCEWNLVKIHVEYLMLRDVRSVQIPGIENLSMKRQHGTTCLLYSKSDMVLMGHPKSHRNDHKHDVHLIVITCRHNYFLFEIHETCRRIWYSSRQNNRNRDKTEKKTSKRKWLNGKSRASCCGRRWCWNTAVITRLQCCLSHTYSSPPPPSIINMGLSNVCVLARQVCSISSFFQNEHHQSNSI